MRNSQYICAGTTSGAVNFLDPNDFRVVKTWQAHAASIHDMDANKNYLVTCGWSNRPHGPPALDHYAQVFDLKRLAQLPPIPFPGGAAFIKIVPTMSTTSVVAAQTGRLQVVDLMNPDTVNLHQANVSGYITNLILAPSGSAWAVVDQDNFVHLWGGSREKLRYTNVNNPIEFADEVCHLPHMALESDL